MLNRNKLQSFKRIFNDILYICGTPLNKIDENEENRDKHVLDKVYCRENLNCSSKIEIPYYLCKGYKAICIYCASKEVTTDQQNYPKCINCKEKPDVKRMKRKQVLAVDIVAKKKK